MNIYIILIAFFVNTGSGGTIGRFNEFLMKSE